MVTKQQEQKIREYLAKRFGARKYRITVDGKVEVHGDMPNSIEIGWWFFGYVDSVEVKRAVFGIPARACQPFTTGDDNAIREMFAESKDAGAIATALERTDGGVYRRMQILGLIPDTGAIRLSA